MAAVETGRNDAGTSRMRSYGAAHYFFFQAEDGIRDVAVTGVQTCALPISAVGDLEEGLARQHLRARDAPRELDLVLVELVRPRVDAGDRGPAGPEPGGERERSEERRVGKEGRSRWAPDQ